MKKPRYAIGQPIKIKNGGNYIYVITYIHNYEENKYVYYYDGDGVGFNGCIKWFSECNFVPVNEVVWHWEKIIGTKV